MVPCDTYDSKGIQAITIYKTYFVCLTEVSSYKRPTIRLCSPSQRQAQIYRQCGERSNANYLKILPKLFEFMFVNDRYKCIGCLIPKTACSSWKFTMVKASGKIDMAKVDHATLHDNAFMHSMGWRLLSTYNAVGIKHRLKTYFKFITVRHPFDRLVSAYKDKLGATAGRYLGGLHARRIKQRYRAVNVMTGRRPGGRVTFAEFIRYVLDTEPQNLDVHWRDYGRLCDPCRVHYDYVVRMETLAADSRAILPRFAASTDNVMPTQNVIQSAEPHSLQGGKSVSLIGSIAARDVRRLQNLYRRDFEMFGYTWRQNNTVAMCSNTSNGSLCC